MEKWKKDKIPKIGMRIFKSAIAIEICYLVSYLRGNEGIVFYSQLAALWCIQMYVKNGKRNAIQRVTGTAVGAIYGLIFLLLKQQTALFRIALFRDAFIAFMIVCVLYTTVLIKRKMASYFSCVVFLSVVVNHVMDENPYLFVWNRFLDTMIGIAVGIGVDLFSLPKTKQKNVLFVSGLDDILLDKEEKLNDYSKVELNRMIDDGMQFTISTERTPATVIEAMQDIRLQLPIIAMDGAVLYDISDKRYLKVCNIPSEQCKRIYEWFEDNGWKCFTNVVVNDMLIIYYQATTDIPYMALVERMRKSPFRNYVNGEPISFDHVVYMLLFYPDDMIENIYDRLIKSSLLYNLKVIVYKSVDVEGYSYLKIYSGRAGKDNMMVYLRQYTDAEQIITLGDMPGKYDIYVKNKNANQIVHLLRKQYEQYLSPQYWFCRKKERFPACNDRKHNI